MEAQLHFPVLRVPASGVEGGTVRAAAAAFQDQDGVRRPHNARGAGEPVEGVAVPQLADVVHHQQSDLQLVRQSFQLAHLLIVAAVGLVPAKGTHHGEGVHRHQHSVRVLPHKAADLLQQAAGHSLRLGGEVGVPRHLLGDAVQPILHPAEGVLQTQVQGGPFLGGQAPHRLPLGDADAPVQHHPGLANLGRTAQEAHPLGQQCVHAEAGGLQVKAHQGGAVNSLQVSLFHRIISFVFHSRPRRREKRWEQCFIFWISWKFKPQRLSQTAWSDGGTTRRAQEIFLPARANSPVMHQCIFAEGWPHLFPQSRREWETQKFPPGRKGGSSVLDPGLHKKAKPQGLFQTARSDGGTIWKAREIFPAARDGSPVMHQCIFAEGRHHHFPQSRMGWEYKTPTSFAKGGSSVYKSKTNR